METYLDNAATTRPYDEVIRVIEETMRESFGNASTRYLRGRAAREIIEESREVVAGALGVDPHEVYFTSGGTESNNLAIQGICRLQRARGRASDIVTSELEHASVAKTVRGLKREGWAVDYVPARGGNLDMAALEVSCSDRTGLISMMSVQNELGYRFPLADVVAVRNARAPQAFVHTDAVQAFGKIPFAPRELGVDLASLSAHKIGGPQGVGALYVKAGVDMFTTAFGGGQERGLRSGTEPVALIAGFAEAVRITMGNREESLTRVRRLQETMVAGLVALRPGIIINSRGDGSPYLVNFSVPHMDSDAVIRFLDERGIYISKASACSELHREVPAHLWREKHPQALLAAGVSEELLSSTFRVSMSATTTQDDIERFLAGFAEACASWPIGD